MKSIQLKRNEDRRLSAGHLWIFSNEINSKEAPLKSYQPGELVKVMAYKGKCMGIGYINPNNLICVRLLSRNPKTEINSKFFQKRIQHALSLRERLYDQPFYRLIFGEGDGLPGLIVDRFDDVLVVQINTAGMDNLQEYIVQGLVSTLKPRSIILKNDTSARESEGLSQQVETIVGDPPEHLDLIENQIPFRCDAFKGQKTGWFFDHSYTRERMTSYVSEKKVLDVYSYAGSWGIQAAVTGASKVTCIDSSQQALEFVQHNAKLNKVDEIVSTRHGDAIEQLKQLHQESEKFDVVIIDPPAFIKRKKDSKKGTEAYIQLNRLAMRLIANDGILISSSCSFHLAHDALQNILLKASRALGCHIQILEQGHQAPDHPIHPAIPETAYLKTFIVRVSHQ